MNQQPPPSNPPQEKKLETSPTSKVSTEITAPNSKWEKVRFVFPQPNVLFGKGVVEYLPDAIYELLTPTIPQIHCATVDRPTLMIVIGSSSLKKSGRLDRIQDLCKQKNIETFLYECGAGEATVDMVNNGVEFAKKYAPQFIAGIGGGSVLDIAKSISGIYTNGGTTQDYHDGKKFDKPGIPFIAVPTTAGTGSEITNNAVLIDRQRGFKQSIRGDNLIAKYILLDPELTLSCPTDTTAYSGADALVQAIEAYVSKNSHPLADIYAMQAIILTSSNLSKAVENGSDYDARSEMLLGQHFGGIAFSNVGLGLVHGLAHPIGYKYNIPHGKICGTLLPWIIEYNLPVRAKKYARIADEMNHLDFVSKFEKDAKDEENALRLIGMIKELLTDIGIPIRLRELGVLKEDFNWIIQNTKGGSVNSNPRTPDPEALRKILESAW
jgi:alcohol dehydrogenase class IV